jgi:hypothetical protein
LVSATAFSCFSANTHNCLLGFVRPGIDVAGPGSDGSGTDGPGNDGPGSDGIPLVGTRTTFF